MKQHQVIWCGFRTPFVRGSCWWLKQEAALGSAWVRKVHHVRDTLFPESLLHQSLKPWCQSVTPLILSGVSKCEECVSDVSPMRPLPIMGPGTSDLHCTPSLGPGVSHSGLFLVVRGLWYSYISNRTVAGTSRVLAFIKSVLTDRPTARLSDKMTHTQLH
jgi:hypothetical protein